MDCGLEVSHINLCRQTHFQIGSHLLGHPYSLQWYFLRDMAGQNEAFDGDIDREGISRASEYILLRVDEDHASEY